jgi:hypothetical protein
MREKRKKREKGSRAGFSRIPRFSRKGAHNRWERGREAVAADRTVFIGEGDDGSQVMVEWHPNVDAEVLYVSTRTSRFARCSTPTECVKTDDCVTSPMAWPVVAGSPLRAEPARSR